MRRLMQSRASAMTCRSAPLPESDPKNHIPYESTRVTTQNRYNDEPEPQQDDMIITHYLKHHPLYEFKDLEEFHVDNYRHWLHGRIDYYNTETYPAEISPWEQGSKFGHMCYLLFPIFSFGFFGT